MTKSARTARPKPKRAKGTTAAAAPSAAHLIDARIADLGDWRGKTLACVRAIINKSHPGITEEWKWSVPVWSCGGIICTGETYKNAVKLTFAKGASLPDPSNLFNSSLQGGTRRAIDLHEGDKVDPKALQALIRSAIELNNAAAAVPPRPAIPPTPRPTRKNIRKG